MPDSASRPVAPLPWWRALLGDLQFWIPLVVLVGGLLLLRWVA
jgi:hypothetical protein